MSRMLKVLYITDQIYLHGGGERVLTNKANYLIENNLAEVYIVTSEQKQNTPCYPISSKVIFEDLEIDYNRSVSYFKWINFKKIPKHFFKLRKAIHSIQPDVIITLSTQFDFYFLPFIKKSIPKIKEYHSSRYFNNKKRESNTSSIRSFVYKLNDYIEGEYDALAILTQDEKQYYRSNNTVVIPNALTTYPDVQSTYTNKCVISAGRIAPVKQFDKLINTWSLVAEVLPDWVLHIYGGGEVSEINYLQELIDSKNLDRQVKLCGSTNDLETKMLNSDLYVMSSQTECFPMVLLEAMSCGLAVVSFDCPHGPRNIITDNVDGVLTENENEALLAKAIISIIKAPDALKKKGNMARESVKRFNADYVMHQWIELFNSLIAEK